MPDFTGVTFANQTVAPADDALVRRALLGDGILTGCEFSYSGYTLTMRSGALIVCGRQIRHPSAQNWAVVGAKTGYARLVLDIDLTKSSTAQLFEQVTTSLEYASAEDGFTALTQENINVSGSHYQAVLCVVSLGDAGITGIVEQMDAAEGGGGNFSVVGGLTQPTSPKENMIWVKADVKKAPKVVFAVAAPESPSDGLIWFTATSAGIITKAYVYADAAWTAVDVYMHLGEAWVHIASQWNGELFTTGDTHKEVTGGWFQNGNYTDNGAFKYYDDDTIWLRDGVVGNVTLGTVNPVDVTDWNTLEIEFVSGNTSTYGLREAQTGGTFVASKTKSGAGAETLTLDISSVSGAYYIGGYGYNMSFDLTRVTLKK